MKKPPLPLTKKTPQPEPVVESQAANKIPPNMAPPKQRVSFLGGVPLRMQIFILIIGFIVIVSFVSFQTSHQFILKDKISSLRELQLLRVEQVRSKLEGRVEVLKGLVLESSLRLLDPTRARPELDDDEWEYLVAGGVKWFSKNTSAEMVPLEAKPVSNFSFELTEGSDWILWSQNVDVVSGNTVRTVPVVAKFKASLIFKALAEFQEGGLGLSLIKKSGPSSYEHVWGNKKTIGEIEKIKKTNEKIFLQVSSLSSQEVVVDDERSYFAWGDVRGVPWMVVSSVEHNALLRGLKFLVANQAFWILIIILLAILITIWFAKKFSKPIETLLVASRRLETGEFSARVEPDGPSELRILGAAFNHMGQALQDREAALKSAQDALIQNEKLAALGTLSAGIAHEVKNPLAGILGNADLLMGQLQALSPQNSKTIQYLEIIRKETKRCREIIDSLMRFSRQETSEVQKVEMDLELVAWDVVNLVEHSLNMQGYKVVKDFAEDISLVKGISNQIQQVLLNMMQNAGHAMEGTAGKQITIGVESFASFEYAPQGSFLALAPQSTSGEVSRIWIRDEGCGMTPEVQRRIFEPFFTTKEVGKGTGLGLAVTMGILADHNVRLSIDSEVGKGTTFFMDFLAVAPRSEAIRQKVLEARKKADGGDQGSFDVDSSESKVNQTLKSDLGLLGDDKPISLSELTPEIHPDQALSIEPKPSSMASHGASPGFSLRKPKLKGS